MLSEPIFWPCYKSSDKSLVAPPTNTIVTLKLDFAAEKGGHGRLGRVETGLFSRTLPIGTKEQIAAHRRDALCPSTQIQKQADFAIIHLLLVNGFVVRLGCLPRE